MKRYLFAFKNKKVKTDNFDAVIIGTGIAGLYTALHIDPKFRVAIVTKADLDESNSYLAQGGIAAVINSDDTLEDHMNDTIRAGAGVCNREAVEILVGEGAENIKRLVDMQVPFDVYPDGDLQITREGGHSFKRIVHCGGDATGKETVKRLMDIAMQRKNFAFFSQSYFVDLLTEDSAVSGVVIRSGDDYRVITANSVLIATGGIGHIYEYTTNPLGAVGDGIAAAARAGAPVTNMEMIQFHPTTLIAENAVPRLFLISEAVRGEGGILKNSKNQAFMQGKHELADLAPRDIVTREILTELERTGDKNVFLDVSSMTRDYFKSRFPTIFNQCESCRIYLTDEKIPVRPAQHYLMGGIQTDIDGQTSVKGLFSCGECADTGVHGANRLASNSLLECLVFGYRCAVKINETTAINKKDTDYTELDSEIKTNRLTYEQCLQIENDIKRIMTKYCGAIRTRSGLETAGNEFRRLGELLDSVALVTNYEFKIYNMYQSAAAVTNGAINRKENIGAHFIADE